jgi:hypothetical protein
LGLDKMAHLIKRRLDRLMQMKKFIMIGNYCENVQEKRQPFRAEHLNHLKDLKKKGILEKAGPTEDLKQIFAIFIHESPELLKKEIEEDIYWKEKIWTDYELKEWIDAV